MHSKYLLIFFLVLFIPSFSHATKSTLTANANFNSAMIHKQNREFSDALADIEQAIRYNPTMGYYQQKAFIHLSMVETAEAISTFQKALRLFPNDPLYAETMWLLGRTYLANGNAVEAEKRFNFFLKNSKLKKSPFRNNAIFRLAITYVLQNRWQEALDTLTENSVSTMAGLFWRAKILYQLNRKPEATELFEKVIQSNPYDYYGILAARHLNKPIIVPTSTEKWPIYFFDLFKQNAEVNDLDPFLLISIAKSESNFVSDRISKAQAFGVMQLLRVTAARFGYDCSLLDPECNIKIGAEYLKLLHDEISFKFNPETEKHTLTFNFAAYNAGEDAVFGWIDKFNTFANTDIDLFVEFIPYGETRDYVKNTYANSIIYSLIYSELPYEQWCQNESNRTQ